ncbi:uncharacterized protein BXZ73DRAFT_105622 [Epithele typhae]|uniref:uncharacterized protein n=1 Tax=Epithele typhae TaxID=378194 RepID=UPI002007CABD|nr:uncharacterized protein BXZ73DRAFT_105622 [Epithele typhae]KAH9917150.1 hypothetical protein BXZ73DRAFT_105622 [Epithele typhae]
MVLSSPEPSPPPGVPPPRAGPTICEALTDELIPCSRELRRHSTARFCQSHGREYRELTQAYKLVSKEVEELKELARLPRGRGVASLATVADAERAAQRMDAWRSAIRREIEARRTQHRRFFPSSEDRGHQKWLESLEADLVRATQMITLLRNRRDVLVAQSEEALRRIEDRRRALQNYRTRRDTQIAAEARDVQRRRNEMLERAQIVGRPSPAPPSYVPSAPRVIPSAPVSPEYWQWQASAGAHAPRPNYGAAADIENQRRHSEAPEDDGQGSASTIGIILGVFMLAVYWWIKG